MSTLDDISALRDRGWTWTRIAAHYGTSERGVRRWVAEGDAPDLAPPADLHNKKCLIINDLQYPYYDPALFEVVTEVAKDFEPTHLLWDGDNLDFPQLGRYNHNAYTLDQADADVAGFHHDCREPLIEAAQSIEEETWNDGNHEYRYEKYVDHNASALATFPDPPTFLQLPAHVTYQRYGKARGTFLLPDLLVAHGWRTNKHAGYAAKNSLDDVGGGISVIVGHTHRIGMHARLTPQGPIFAYEVGHMADMERVPKNIEGMNNWQQIAGTLVTYNEDEGWFDVKLCPVLGPDRDVVIANDREYRISR